MASDWFSYTLSTIEHKKQEKGEHRANLIGVSQILLSGPGKFTIFPLFDDDQIVGSRLREIESGSEIILRKDATHAMEVEGALVNQSAFVAKFNDRNYYQAEAAIAQVLLKPKQVALIGSDHDYFKGRDRNYMQ